MFGKLYRARDAAERRATEEELKRLYVAALKARLAGIAGGPEAERLVREMHPHLELAAKNRPLEVHLAEKHAPAKLPAPKTRREEVAYVPERDPPREHKHALLATLLDENLKLRGMMGLTPVEKRGFESVQERETREREAERVMLERDVRESVKALLPKGATREQLSDAVRKALAHRTGVPEHKLTNRDVQNIVRQIWE